MNAMSSSLLPFSRLTRLGLCASLCLLLLPVARADVVTARLKAKGPIKNLVGFFPAPVIGVIETPGFFVTPLLGPAKELLPGGKLVVWVGRNDGTPYALADVVLGVPAGDALNTLVDAGQRVTLVTLKTDINGLAQAFLAAPAVPPPNNGGNGGNGNGNGNGGE